MKCIASNFSSYSVCLGVTFAFSQNEIYRFYFAGFERVFIVNIFVSPKMTYITIN